MTATAMAAAGGAASVCVSMCEVGSEGEVESSEGELESSEGELESSECEASSDGQSDSDSDSDNVTLRELLQRRLQDST